MVVVVVVCMQVAAMFSAKGCCAWFLAYKAV